MRNLLLLAVLCIGILPTAILGQTPQTTYLNFTANPSEGYGVYAYQGNGHTIPYTQCGLPQAYYYMVSADQATSILPNGDGALRIAPGGVGFANFDAALASNGYTHSQVIMRFEVLSLGDDVVYEDWFFEGDTETRFYQPVFPATAYTFYLDGEPLITGLMPNLVINIDYNIDNDCFDDNIFGLTQYTGSQDASSSSSAGVQAVATALLQDIGDTGIRFRYGQVQPAAQGTTGAVFGSAVGRIESGTVWDPTLDTATVADPTPNQCLTSQTTATLDGTGGWQHFDFQGERIVSILNTQNMGLTTVDFYVNSNAVRETSAGLEYLDRNFTIVPTTQPSGDVRVRIYFTATEWENFLLANDLAGSEVLTLDDLEISKFGTDQCEPVYTDGGQVNYLDVVETGQTDGGYYVDIIVQSFSSFFVSGTPPDALPVELTRFEATRRERDVELTWSMWATGSFDKMHLERSRDGVEWRTLTELPLPTTAYSDYRGSHTDRAPGEGTWYYRLAWQETDGRVEYSEVVSTTIIPTADLWSAFPNPTHGPLTLRNLPLGAEVRVTTALGQLILTENNRDTTTLSLDLSAYPGGVYLVSVHSGSTVRTIRVMR